MQKQHSAFFFFFFFLLGRYGFGGDVCTLCGGFGQRALFSLLQILIQAI